MGKYKVTQSGLDQLKAGDIIHSSPESLNDLFDRVEYIDADGNDLSLKANGVPTYNGEVSAHKFMKIMDILEGN